MAYSLNGFNITSKWGIEPIKPESSDISLSGFLDLPSRLGKCYHSWNASHGVQPYTNANEIRLSGRDLMLYGLIRGVDKEDCIIKLHSFYRDINSFTSLVPLIHPYGTHLVYIKEPIIGDYIGKKGLIVNIPFREPEVSVGGTPPSPSDDYGIDGIPLSSLNAVLMSMEGDRRNRTQTKEQNFTAYRKEGYQITKTDISKLSLRLFIRASNYTSFSNSIKSFQQLFINPGERNLIIKNDLQRRIFACEGFKVSDIRNNDGWYGFLDITVIESQLPQALTYLGTNIGDLITDSLNNKILIKWQ